MDPDPQSAWIRSDFGRLDPNPDPGWTKLTPEKIVVMDVLSLGLEASSLSWASFMEALGI